MSLKTTIENDMKQAMLQKNKEDLTALRAIKSMILLAQSEKGAGKELSPDDEMKLLAKAAKQRKESAEIYREKGRDELAAKEERELGVINRYLPKQLTQEELETELKRIIAQTGAASPSDMGKVMGIATKSLAGKADGKQIADTVKSLLNQD